MLGHKTHLNFKELRLYRCVLWLSYGLNMICFYKNSSWGFFLKTRSWYLAQAGLEFSILLPQTHEYWDCRLMLLYPAMLRLHSSMWQCQKKSLLGGVWFLGKSLHEWDKTFSQEWVSSFHIGYHWNGYLWIRTTPVLLVFSMCLPVLLLSVRSGSSMRLLSQTKLMLLPCFWLPILHSCEPK
jgi:hypothetical protein